MLNTLRAAASLVKDALDIFDRLKEKFDSHKRRHLAQTLYLLYSRLNECLTTGEQIIETLERFSTDPKNMCQSDKYYVQVDGIILEELIARQIQNLHALANCLNDYSEIVRTLDAPLYVRLKQFVAFKGVGVDWIAYLLKRGSIPFDALGLDDIERLALLSQYMTFDEDEPENGRDPISDTIANFLPWHNRVGEISRRIDGASLEIDLLFNQTEADFGKAPNAEQLARLREFLAHNDLRELLRATTKDMKTIREFIEKNFSIVDIMLDVGCDQLKQGGLY